MTIQNDFNCSATIDLEKFHGLLMLILVTLFFSRFKQVLVAEQCDSSNVRFLGLCNVSKMYAYIKETLQSIRSLPF